MCKIIFAHLLVVNCWNLRWIFCTRRELVYSRVYWLYLTRVLNLVQTFIGSWAKIFGQFHGTSHKIKNSQCPFANNSGVVLVTHFPQNCVREDFLYINRYLFKWCTDWRRVFLFYINILTRIFADNVPFPGLYGGLYGENLPYKFKKLYGDFQNRKSEKIILVLLIV